MTMFFRFQKVAYFVPWKRLKYWSAFKSENAPRDDDEKAFPPFHLTLERATCVGESFYWTTDVGRLERRVTIFIIKGKFQ